MSTNTDPRGTDPIAALAADPLLDTLDVGAAVQVLGKTRAPIKAVLLDQTRLLAGIGNWVADDVLLEARIHPTTPARELEREQVQRLLEAATAVCK